MSKYLPLLKATASKVLSVFSAFAGLFAPLKHPGVQGAIFLAGLIAMFSSLIAQGVVSPEKLEKNAIEITALESGAGGAAAGPKGPEPVLALLATADIERGKSAAKACAACHSFDKGGANGVGPYLWNTMGGKKQHAAGFAYSGALAEHGGPKWTLAEMNKFLYKPKEYAPGTKMSFAGLKKPEDRAAVIAYLRTLADSPVAMPSQAEIDAEMAELAPPAPEVPAEGAVEGAAEGETPAEGAVAPAADAKTDAKAAEKPADKAEAPAAAATVPAAH